ncbi:hypothetical protein QBC47DRAFT_31179 [Echria macrotheca]|uniref:F-box domain-containing protein n=1 Tax=Echria macrotheca TaxID=438768 RepID=A0AAJ0FBX4_9PEZI|nr:hypothetical protein QBC47DRAFT_31179 [Echria macrotheca]
MESGQPPVPPPPVVSLAPTAAVTPVIVVEDDSEPEQTVGSGQTLLHGLMGDTVRNSISSLASYRDRRSRKDPSNLAVAKRVSYELQEFKSPQVPRTFLTLPPEIHLLVMLQLSFADIERLRRTCKQIRGLATPRQIRALLGPMHLQDQLLRHCKNCLTYDGTRSQLLLSTPRDPGYPLASCCINCAMASRDKRIQPGRKVHLANFETTWVCRWCGWPIGAAAMGNDQFHTFCYRAYNRALFFYFLLGWLQLSLGVIASALAWRYFRNSVLVFAPTLTSFLLLWVCLVLIIFRGNKHRTYHWTLLFESAILGLWVPPVYHIASQIGQLGDEPLPRSTIVALVFFAFNIIFRLFNVLGNIVLMCGFNMTRRHWPNPSRWRKICHPILSFLVFWTYPQAVDRKYSQA